MPDAESRKAAPLWFSLLGACGSSQSVSCPSLSGQPQSDDSTVHLGLEVASFIVAVDLNELLLDGRHRLVRTASSAVLVELVLDLPNTDAEHVGNLHSFMTECIDGFEPGRLSCRQVAEEDADDGGETERQPDRLGRKHHG